MLLEDALRLSRINQARSRMASGFIIGNAAMDMTTLLYEADHPSRRRKLGHWLELNELGPLGEQIRSYEDWEPLRPVHPLEALAEEADDNGA